MPYTKLYINLEKGYKGSNNQGHAFRTKAFDVESKCHVFILFTV